MNLRTGRAGVKVLQKMAGRSPQKVAILIGFLSGPLGVSAFSAFKSHFYAEAAKTHRGPRGRLGPKTHFCAMPMAVALLLPEFRLGRELRPSKVQIKASARRDHEVGNTDNPAGMSDACSSSVLCFLLLFFGADSSTAGVTLSTSRINCVV